MRKPTVKLTPKEEQATFRAAGRMYAKLFDKPVQPMDIEPVKRPAVFRSARDRVPHVENGRNEQDVKGGGVSLLRRHPKVRMVCSHNSGGTYFGEQFVIFSRIYVKGVKDVRLVDCVCFLTNGGVLAIDWKHPTKWKEPDWERLLAKEINEGLKGMLSKDEAKELGQWRFLNIVASLPNGIGIFATDVSQVIEALKGA